ncbi:hypothetical protein [Streptomyces sp. CC208A]|uniref:hypothetical protein n=1 Tax=Streptomyces sp. CC208A TaxID=3044573 RepID=UPI0024A8A193|nr:hypothetical protein [Streptomyces sp. CC208A]
MPPAPAAPPRDTVVSGAKPRLRERYTRTQLVLRGVLALLAAHGVALYTAGTVAGDWENPLIGILAVLLVSFIGGGVGAFVCVAGSMTGGCFLLLWRIARRGKRVRARFVRRKTTKGVHQHVFAVTDVTGRQHEHTRTAGGPNVAPLPYRTVWYLQGAPDKDTLLGAWAPLWLTLGACVGTAVTLTAAWLLTFYVIPGMLLRTLF